MNNFQDRRYEELLKEVRILSGHVQTLQFNFERLADNQDLMMEAPSEVDEKQLKELSIKKDIKKN